MIQFDKDTQGGGGNQETLSRGCMAGVKWPLALRDFRISFALNEIFSL